MEKRIIPVIQVKIDEKKQEIEKYAKFKSEVGDKEDDISGVEKPLSIKPSLRETNNILKQTQKKPQPTIIREN